MKRRDFIALSVFAGGARAASHAVRLGGPVFLKSDDPGELAREHRRLGYSAAYCPNAKVEDTVRVRAIEKAFAAEKVVIAEVGAWKNMLDPDPVKRRENLDYVTQRLALAEAVGAMCCVDIAGSFHPTVWYGPHPKNFSREFFDATVENCRKVIDAVKPKRTFFTVEMMGWALPTGPEEYLALIKAIDRAAFAVHLDPCNGVNSPERFYNNAGFISDCVRKLGRWIRSCHAKDLEWRPEMNIHFIEVIPGRGSIDYQTYLRALATLAHQPPLMLEHLKTAEEYKEGAEHIVKTGAAIGVAFG
jgi:sugar phosphate isomerase/epimerase